MLKSKKIFEPALAQIILLALELNYAIQTANL